MIRAACAVLGTLALLAPSLPLQDVDATTFALAFRDGKADQYKNKRISGSGVSFHGAVKERIADGSTRTSLVITLAEADPQGALKPIKTWDEFVAAERGRATLVVALSGADLPSPPAQEPAASRSAASTTGRCARSCACRRPPTRRAPIRRARARRRPPPTRAPGRSTARRCSPARPCG